MAFSDLLPLLTQIPLVGVFIWFVLERDKRELVAKEHRDAEWRGFLKEQRESTNGALKTMADSLISSAEKQTNGLEQVAEKVVILTGIMAAHDIRTQEYQSRRME